MITTISVRGRKPADMPPNFVYVGRKIKDWQGSPLGNPYRPEAGDPPGKAIKSFRQWLWMKMQNPHTPQAKELQRLSSIAKSGDLLLGCWCAPNPCHADVIKAAIEWMIRSHHV